MEGRPDNIAIWLKKDKNGKTYFSCAIEIGGQKHKMAAFRNDKKDRDNPEDNRPDYRGQVRTEKTDEAPF